MKKWKKTIKEERKDYYYIYGNLGMMKSGSFSRDKKRWMIFDQEDKDRMEQRNIKPYGAVKLGKFVSIEKF